jgi:hypothetical protein
VCRVRSPLAVKLLAAASSTSGFEDRTQRCCPLPPRRFSFLPSANGPSTNFIMGGSYRLDSPGSRTQGQERSFHLRASSCTATRCSGRSHGVQVLRSASHGSRAYSMQDPASELRRIPLPRRWVNRWSCNLALTDLGSNPPSIACRIFHPAASVRIAFPLLRLIDGETTGFESPPV